jgi:hypothetical protein
MIEMRRARQVKQDRMWEDSLEDKVHVRAYLTVTRIIAYRQKAFESFQRYSGKELIILKNGFHIGYSRKKFQPQLLISGLYTMIPITLFKILERPIIKSRL